MLSRGEKLVAKLNEGLHFLPDCPVDMEREAEDEDDWQGISCLTCC
jgi:hypothetical protein